MAHTNNPGSRRHAEAIEQLKLAAQAYARAWSLSVQSLRKDVQEGTDTAHVAEREEELRQAALRYASIAEEDHESGQRSC